MDISAKDVKSLREKTGAGIMDCKKALIENGGNFDEAVKYLREQGILKAAKKTERPTREGIINAYIHPGDKLGVLLEINCETDFVARTDDFQNLAKDICMQVAASDPKFIARQEVSQDVIDQEMEIYKNQAKSEGKPDNVIDKIVEGKLDKYYSETCLLEQPFIKDTDRAINDIIKDAIAKLGENITISRFIRYKLGEDIA